MSPGLFVSLAYAYSVLRRKSGTLHLYPADVIRKIFLSEAYWRLLASALQSLAKQPSQRGVCESYRIRPCFQIHDTMPAIPHYSVDVVRPEGHLQ
jgi:hypothetical protein